MKNNFFQIGFVFIAILTLQVLVLNNFQVFGYINPKAYILFVFLLPNNLNRSLLLFLSFLIGLGVDIFENSGGIHASATLFLGFIRPFLLRIINSAGGAEFQIINLERLGLQKFLTYISTGTLIHHLWLFTLEAFNFRNYLLVVYETILSSLFTIILILIIELLFNRKTDR